MRGKLLKALTAAGLAAAVAAGIAAAAGPTPGFAQDGVAGPNGQVQYTATKKGKSTLVQAVRLRDARVLRSATLRGSFGVPLVAYDGTAGGVTHDGRLLVLETAGGVSTTFAVLTTKSLKVRQRFTLRGLWAYDAVSPTGQTLYLTQILSQATDLRYLVRAYDLVQRTLVPGAIADKSEPDAMAGYPMSRVASTDGTWAYTLYTRPGKQPFIHALNTRDRAAVCLDLTWPGDPNNMGNVRLTLSADEKQLVVRQFATGKALLTVAAPG